MRNSEETDVSSALTSRSRVRVTPRNMIHAEKAIAILRSASARSSIVAADFVTPPPAFRYPSAFAVSRYFSPSSCSRIRHGHGANVIATNSPSWRIPRREKDRGSIFGTAAGRRRRAREVLAIAKREEGRHARVRRRCTLRKPVPRFQLFMHLARRKGGVRGGDRRAGTRRNRIRVDVELLPRCTPTFRVHRDDGERRRAECRR